MAHVSLTDSHLVFGRFRRSRLPFLEAAGRMRLLLGATAWDARRNFTGRVLHAVLPCALPFFLSLTLRLSFIYSSALRNGPVASFDLDSSFRRPGCCPGPRSCTAAAGLRPARRCWRRSKARGQLRGKTREDTEETCLVFLRICARLLCERLLCWHPRTSLLFCFSESHPKLSQGLARDLLCAAW